MTGAELRDEVVELARDLIRVDTSNPPGRETPAAELVAEYLTGAEVECELAGPDPERLNLVARVEGRGEGPSLMLLGHTDVVPAPTDRWTVPPFEARLRDGELLGRGAADMKGEVAARAVAIAALARGEERPPGDVILVAAADEERNMSDVGMSWLARERPDLRCDFALNEGGGWLLELASGRRVVTIGIGEKQTTSVRLRIHGRAGHASVPDSADNPLRHVAAAIERLLGRRRPPQLEPDVGRALRRLGAPDGDDEEALAWACGQHPLLAEMLPSMARTIVTPTGLRTHEPANVIPPYADVICDCRALPGDTVDDIRAHIEGALGGEFTYEVELLEPLVGGSRSETDTPLYRACERYVARRLPGAELLPVVSTGFTDSHWVREAHDSVTYGFAPVFSTDIRAYVDRMHGADECIDVADLVEIAEFHLEVLSTGLGGR